MREISKIQETLNEIPKMQEALHEIPKMQEALNRLLKQSGSNPKVKTSDAFTMTQ